MQVGALGGHDHWEQLVRSKDVSTRHMAKMMRPYLDFGVVGYRGLAVVGWQCDFKCTKVVLCHLVRVAIPFVCMCKQMLSSQ